MTKIAQQTKNNLIKLVWTNWGSNLGIGVYTSTRKEAERIYNGCYNYGATDGEFHILKDDKHGCFGYFSATWESLKKVAQVPYIAPLLPKTQKEIDGSRENYLEVVLKHRDNFLI